MQSLTNTTKNVEHEWLNTLHRHLVNLYVDFHLPSHDVEHHLRVWSFCKQLLLELERVGCKFSKDFVTQSLIACMFHDTGLIIDSSENHGKMSRAFCEEFFVKNKDLKVDDVGSILSAIEMHDDKSLKQSSNRSTLECINLHQIVSTADDLDAFGNIGVFRYIEIYTIRKVNINDLPLRVMENLTNRFANFERLFPNLNELVNIQRIRYAQTFNFFLELQKEIKQKSSGIIEFQHIVDSFVDCLIIKQMDIYQTITYVLSNEEGELSQLFFENLRLELDQFKPTLS